MASACVNNISIPPEPFPPPYTWQPDIPDPDLSPPEFEFFHLDDPPTMLPTADELFSDGKLVPLQISTARSAALAEVEVKPPAAAAERVKIDHVDPHVFSPRAPTCSIRWRNILRLKRLQLTKAKSASSQLPNEEQTGTSNPARSLTSILNRAAGSKPPAQKDSDTESVSTSSRLSLSSSSSSSSHDEAVPKQRRAGSGSGSGSSSGSGSGVLAESPRLNSSGKVVFERSSSSPGSFSGGPRYKHGGIERSYSAHVRVAPVLNVPVVCSIRGTSKFGFPLFGPHKKEGTGVGNHRVQLQRRNSKNNNHRTEQQA